MTNNIENLFNLKIKMFKIILLKINISETMSIKRK